jgi:hypothetical protein
MEEEQAAPARRNWTKIALVAVSIVAVLLLASTITLAALGDFGGHHGPEATGRIGNQPGGPAQRQGYGGEQRTRPANPGNQNGQKDRRKDQQVQPSPPESQSE